MKICIVISVLIFSLVGCTSSKFNRQEPEFKPFYYDILQFTSDFNWQNSRPIDFLNHLKKVGRGYVLTGGILYGWIKEEDIPELVILLDSDERCAGVAAIISSFHDKDYSTVGNEAAYLIEGFKRGRYPPALDSTNYDINKEEIKQWWERYLNQQN